MPAPVAAAAIKLVLSLLPELIQVLAEALQSDDPKDALAEARAAARMAGTRKARDASKVKR